MRTWFPAVHLDVPASTVPARGAVRDLHYTDRFDHSCGSRLA